MPITLSQKAAIEEVIHVLLNVTAIRSKRPVKLASMFMDLVDRTEWPAYYDVIPEPRCLINIQASVEKGRYKEASDVYTDLSLVFWNALFYNEPDSQIAMDAGSLKTLLEAEWTKRSMLPQLRSSPPPSSAQKVHGVAAESKNTTLASLPAAPTRTATPAGQVPNASSTVPTQQHASDPEVDIITPDSEVGNDVDGGGDGENTRKKIHSDGNPGRTQPQQQQPPPPPPATTTTGIATSQTTHAVQSQNPYQHFQQPYVQQQQQQQQIVNQPQTQRSTTLGPDRSIITAAGGITAIGGPSQVEKLPADTAKLFDRDPTTNEVLWFAAPPMNMSRARGPRYSLEYLTFIATKRKRREASTDEVVDREEGTKGEWGKEGSASAKRPRVGFSPTVGNNK